MSVALLDVNVLLALLDPGSVHFDEAHAWFRAEAGKGWASCAITENGCVRILSRPGFPTETPLSPAEAADYVTELCAASAHEFWPQEISILDRDRFDLRALRGAKQVTDAYLLGLAVSRGGRFVTFDRSVPVKAVRAAKPSHLAVLG